MSKKSDSSVRIFRTTDYGKVVIADAVVATRKLVSDNSVDLIITSPPFGLVRKKQYGNVNAEEYTEWFKPFGAEFKRILKPNGSLVIDIGGAWVPRQPTRSLYHFKLLIMLCEELGFHLAQEFYWWSPSKLPTPAEWVTVRRIRVKDAVNCIWWLSPTPWPRADNRRVLQPYSESMKSLLRNGYRAKLRPSGHDISTKFQKDNRAAIPPNVIAFPNTESNSYYLRYCREHKIKPHPARFPAEIPEYFVRMLTDPQDLVVDPFAGSCVTGEVCESLKRKWICVDLVEEYVLGAEARFKDIKKERRTYNEDDPKTSYRLHRPGYTWNSDDTEPLLPDGGQQRRIGQSSRNKKGHGKGN